MSLLRVDVTKTQSGCVILSVAWQPILIASRFVGPRKSDLEFNLSREFKGNLVCSFDQCEIYIHAFYTAER